MKDDGYIVSVASNEEAALSAILSQYQSRLMENLAVVDDLRRQAEDLGPAVSAQVVPLLAAVGENVRRSQERTAVLMEWLRVSDLPA